MGGVINRTPFHHADHGQPERLRLEHLDHHATLTRGDGSTLMVPAAWLPREAKAGDLLLCSYEPGGNRASVTFELGVPDEVEEAIALEG